MTDCGNLIGRILYESTSMRNVRCRIEIRNDFKIELSIVSNKTNAKLTDNIVIDGNCQYVSAIAESVITAMTKLDKKEEP